MEPQCHLLLAPLLALGFLVTEVTLHGDHGIRHETLVVPLNHLGLLLVTVEHMNDWTLCIHLPFFCRYLARCILSYRHFFNGAPFMAPNVR
jgi:hypothetical protein